MQDKRVIRDLYDAGAGSYHWTTLCFRLIGLRMQAYRTQAVDALRLQPGGCVVELGCGTGINFPLVLDRIGPRGRLVGVDLSGGMLDLARRRIDRAGWKNVELVKQDVSTLAFPSGLDGVLAMGVFGYLADYDAIIRSAAEALSPGGRMVLLDGKKPETLWPWLFRIVLLLGRRYGFTEEYFDVRPWEAMERWFAHVSIEQRYGGMIYIASGKAP